MKKIFAAFLAVLMLCSCAQQKPDDGRMTVYTSFYVMYNFTKMIAGDRADVKELIPPGVEAHDWEPGTSDMIALSNADVFVYNGADMEPWAESIIGSIDSKNLKTIEAGEKIAKINEDGKSVDPHVWLNPKNAIAELEKITEGLCEKDPKNAEFYRRNLETAKSEIVQTDSEYRQETEKFSDKEIIVTHGAFAYLCAEYGLTQHMLEGLSGESDPSAASVRDIIDYMKQNNKKAIFYVSSEGSKLAENIVAETGASLYPLDTFENGADGKSYVQVMRENLENLKKALKNDEE